MHVFGGSVAFGGYIILLATLFCFDSGIVVLKVCAGNKKLAYPPMWWTSCMM